MSVFEYLPEFRTEQNISRLRRNPAHVIVLECRKALEEVSGVSRL